MQTEGLLGKVPEGVESIAELMLQDSDINVYQQQKVTLKEEAFYIRGKKQKTAAQKQQIIKERQQTAIRHYKRIQQAQIDKLKKEENALPSLLLREKTYVHSQNPDYDTIVYRAEYKQPEAISNIFGNLDSVKGMRGVKDFDAYEAGRKNRAGADITGALQ